MSCHSSETIMIRKMGITKIFHEGKIWWGRLQSSPTRPKFTGDFHRLGHCCGGERWRVKCGQKRWLGPKIIFEPEWPKMSFRLILSKNKNFLKAISSGHTWLKWNSCTLFRSWKKIQPVWKHFGYVSMLDWQKNWLSILSWCMPC